MTIKEREKNCKRAGKNNISNIKFKFTILDSYFVFVDLTFMHETTFLSLQCIDISVVTNSTIGGGGAHIHI